MAHPFCADFYKLQEELENIKIDFLKSGSNIDIKLMSEENKKGGTTLSY